MNYRLLRPLLDLRGSPQFLLPPARLAPSHKAVSHPTTSLSLSEQAADCWGLSLKEFFNLTFYRLLESTPY